MSVPGRYETVMTGMKVTVTLHRRPTADEAAYAEGVMDGLWDEEPDFDGMGEDYDHDLSVDQARWRPRADA